MTGNGSGNGPDTSQHDEWVVSLADGFVTKIERVDQVSGTRTELSGDEYAWVASGYYAAYYAGIRDYANAIASGNIDAAQAYYQGMTQYLGAIGQA